MLYESWGIHSVSTRYGHIVTGEVEYGLWEEGLPHGVFQ